MTVTYNSCKKLILTKNYEEQSMTKKLDLFLLWNRITDEEYTELMELMKGDK